MIAKGSWALEVRTCAIRSISEMSSTLKSDLKFPGDRRGEIISMNCPFPIGFLQQASMAVNINIIQVCFQLYYPVRYQSELCRVLWITSDGMSSRNMNVCERGHEWRSRSLDAFYYFHSCSGVHEDLLFIFVWMIFLCLKNVVLGDFKMPRRKQTELLGEQNEYLGTIISSSGRSMLGWHLQDLNSAGFNLL